MTYSNISKSKELYNTLNSIAQELWEYQENQRQYEKNDPFFISLDVLEEKFTLVLKSLIHQSAEDNFFWQYCPIEVYRRYFQKRKEFFVDKYLNSTATDFINEELNLLKSDKWNYYFPNPRYGVEKIPVPFSPLSNDLHRTLIFIKKRKEEFLKAELKKNEKNPEFYSDYDDKILPTNYIREIKNRSKILTQFITSGDNDKKLELLPYNNFLKQYNQLPEENQIKLLFELKRLILNGAISKAYLLKEWEDINFKEFVNSQLENIDRINDLEMEIQNNTLSKSNLAKNEKENSAHSDYRNFWAPLLSTNPKSGEPYMTEENFKIFIENIIDNNKDIKPITWPGFSKAELQHGAALFISRFKFNKWNIVRIFMNTFPKIFNKNKKDEYTNIRVRYNTSVVLSRN